jgi:hypothetical protein
MVGLDALRGNGHNLNSLRYVDIAAETAKLDPTEKMREVDKKHSASESRMNALLAEFGFEV